MEDDEGGWMVLIAFVVVMVAIIAIFMLLSQIRA